MSTVDFSIFALFALFVVACSDEPPPSPPVAEELTPQAACLEVREARCDWYPRCDSARPDCMAPAAHDCASAETIYGADGQPVDLRAAVDACLGELAASECGPFDTLSCGVLE